MAKEVAWRAFDTVQTAANADWKHINGARERAAATLEKIQMTPVIQRMPADTEFVVYGSLARGEQTEGDVDWTMLVDGQADSQHMRYAQTIAKELEAQGFVEPHKGGAFGNLAFSHELLNKVGGDYDTNRNTTQRVLLLLESRALGDAIVRQRVIKQLFTRYLEGDATCSMDNPSTIRVPRYLLNDFVRFWRTMAVDFPAKQRERGVGWALRSLKLRMSRKLIFSAGLLTCLDLVADPKIRKAGDADRGFAILDYLENAANTPPLETLARALLAHSATDAANDVFGAYDEFLGILNDKEERERLNSLDKSSAVADGSLERCKAIGEKFQKGLTKLFFASDNDLTTLTQRYGVF